MCIVEHRIANIISMVFLEKEGYKVSYETGGTWIVITPAGGNINSNKEKGEHY